MAIWIGWFLKLYNSEEEQAEKLAKISQSMVSKQTSGSINCLGSLQSKFNIFDQLKEQQRTATQHNTNRTSSHKPIFKIYIL